MEEPGKLSSKLPLIIGNLPSASGNPASPRHPVLGSWQAQAFRGRLFQLARATDSASVNRRVTLLLGITLWRRRWAWAPGEMGQPWGQAGGQFQTPRGPASSHGLSCLRSHSARTLVALKSAEAGKSHIRFPQPLASLKSLSRVGRHAWLTSFETLPVHRPRVPPSRTHRPPSQRESSGDTESQARRGRASVPNHQVTALQRHCFV